MAIAKEMLFCASDFRPLMWEQNCFVGHFLFDLPSA
jgi:hypothetical protein